MTQDKKPHIGIKLPTMDMNSNTRVVIDQTAKTRNIKMFCGLDAPDEAMAYAAQRADEVANRPVAVFGLIAGFGQTVAAMPIDRDGDNEG